MNVSEWRTLAPTTALTVLPPPLSPSEVTPLAEAFAQRSRAANTLRGYRTDWARWTAWAALNGAVQMPANPRAVEAWLCEEASTHTPGTLGRRVAALRLAHELAGFPSPIDSHVRRVLEGIRRTVGRPARRVAPMLLEDLRAAVATLDLDTLEGLRDRAALTIGWAGAFRRSELVALRVDDVSWTDDGIRVMVRRSKTDQGGTGQAIGIPHARPEHDDVCPPCSLADWLGTAKLELRADLPPSALADQGRARGDPRQRDRRAGAARDVPGRDRRRMVRALAPCRVRHTGGPERDGRARHGQADPTPQARHPRRVRARG